MSHIQFTDSLNVIHISPLSVLRLEQSPSGQEWANGVPITQAEYNRLYTILTQIDPWSHIQFESPDGYRRTVPIDSMQLEKSATNQWINKVIVTSDEYDRVVNVLDGLGRFV